MNTLMSIMVLVIGKGTFMSKHPVNVMDFKKIIKTTQSIEGYKEASAEVIKKVMSLKEKYGVKVQGSR